MSVSKIQVLGRDTTVRTYFNPAGGVTNSTTHGGCYYERYGNVVHIHAGCAGLTPGGTDYTIITLPVECRPASPVFAHGTGGSWNNLGYLDIRADGSVHIRSEGTACGAELTYIV